jgi:hypothetical protein
MSSANRTKVDFDPLSGFGGGSTASASPPSESNLGSTSRSQTSATSSHAALDTGSASAVLEERELFVDRTFTTQKSKSKSAAGASGPTTSSRSRPDVVYITSSVLASKPTRSDPFMQSLKLTDDSMARATVEPLPMPANMSHYSSPALFNSSNLGGRTNGPKTAVDDAMEGLLDTTPSVAGPGTGTFRLNVEKKGDDSKVDDLEVKGMLELEEELDYELFGKSNAAIGGGDKKKIAAAAVVASQPFDSSVLSSSIFDLRINDTAPLSVYNEPVVEFAAPQSVNDSEVMQSLQTGDFDINAYIQSQNAETGGGLFD